MRETKRARWLLGATGLLVLMTSIWAAVHFEVANLDADALAEQVRGSGALGPAVLIGLLVLQSIVSPLPSQPMLVAAGFVYGPAVGFLIGWTGVLAGACTCFGLARGLGRPFVERFASPERLDSVDRYVSGRGVRSTFVVVLSLRFFAQIAFDVVSYSCGLVRFAFHWFLLATAIGEIPKVYLFSYFGAGLGDQRGSIAWLMAAGALGTLVLFVGLIRRASPSLE